MQAKSSRLNQCSLEFRRVQGRHARAAGSSQWGWRNYKTARTKGTRMVRQSVTKKREQQKRGPTKRKREKDKQFVGSTYRCTALSWHFGAWQDPGRPRFPWEFIIRVFHLSCVTRRYPNRQYGLQLPKGLVDRSFGQFFLLSKYTVKRRAQRTRWT